MSQAIGYIPPEDVRADIQKQIEFVKTVVPPEINRRMDERRRSRVAALGEF